MLFVPFLELKLKQNLSQVENNSIGMGLACSSAIIRALDGDITLKKSKRGLTSFAFKIPVNKIRNGSFAAEKNECTLGAPLSKHIKMQEHLE